VSPALTEEQRHALLDLARRSIAASVDAEPLVSPEPREWPDASGVFVTIKRRGALRGCLGTLRTRGTLDREVIRCARESATEDPRFPAVAAEELPELSVEISVLGPLESIDPHPGAFTIGVHGLVVEQGAYRGLLLPQVATEWGWTAEQFLRQTCVKAGLPQDAWQQGARVYRFAAEVFGD
jgi:uncharacterized protein